MATTTVIRHGARVPPGGAEPSGPAGIPDAEGTAARVVHLGLILAGAAAVELDGRSRFVTPGLIDVRSHTLFEPMDARLLAELGSPGLDNASVFECLSVFEPDDEGMVACARRALVDLLTSGLRCWSIAPPDGRFGAHVER